MELRTEHEETMIVKSVVGFANGKRSTMTMAAYQYISGMAGFIAHYNKDGFEQEYSDRNKLRSEIKRNAQVNLYGNFRPGDKGYKYYKQMAAMYRTIVSMLR